MLKEIEERWKREVAERYYTCYESGIGRGVRERGEIVELANAASPHRSVGERAMEKSGLLRAFAYMKLKQYHNLLRRLQSLLSEVIETITSAHPSPS
jgi:hypothetical protein